MIHVIIALCMMVCLNSSAMEEGYYPEREKRGEKRKSEEELSLAPREKKQKIKKTISPVKEILEPREMRNKQTGEYEVKNVPVGHLTITDKDSLTLTPYKELIQQRTREGLSYIIAGLMTEVDKVEQTDYFDAYAILSYIFGQNFINPPKNRYTSAPITPPPFVFKPNPNNSAPIIDQIKLYTINSSADPAFTYLGSDYDLHANTVDPKVRNFVVYFLLANKPQEVVASDQAALIQRIHAQANLGAAYLEGFGTQKNHKKAKQYLEKAAEQTLDPAVQAKAALNLGLMNLRENDYEGAIRYFEKVATQTADPASQAKAALNLGMIYFDKKDYEKALQYLEKAETQTVHPALQAKAALNLGLIYFNKKDYGKALQYYEKAATQIVDPVVQATANSTLGVIYSEKKDYEKALQYYEKAVAQTADPVIQAKTAVNLGSLYFKGVLGQPNYERAKSYFELVAAQTRDLVAQADANFNLGIVYKLLKQPVQAKPYFEKAGAQTADLSTQAEANTSLGDIYYDEQDYEKAKTYYEKVAAQTLNLVLQAQALLNIGNIYFEHEDYKQAIKYYEQAAAQTADTETSISANYNLSKLYFEDLKQPEKALEYLKKIEHDYPEDFDPEAALLKNRIEQALGKQEQGAEPVSAHIADLITQATQTSDLVMQAQANFNLGRIYFDAKDYAQARSYYEQAAAQTADLVVKDNANYSLARIYFKPNPVTDLEFVGNIKALEYVNNIANPDQEMLAFKNQIEQALQSKFLMNKVN